MSEDNQSVLSHQDLLAFECTRAVLEGLDTITISKSGPIHTPPGFPRGELLSVGTNGVSNYAVCPIKVLAWIHRGTKASRIHLCHHLDHLTANNCTLI